MQSLMPPVDAPNNEFNDGNPSLGTLGTIVSALFLNNVQAAIRSVQNELLSILSEANINPDGDSNTQVLQAIKKIMVDSNMSVPYGIPLAWPTSTPPTGYLICNGASFSAVTYPQLAAVYTNGVLPDLRGQTIKGLPASGRALLSLEGDEVKVHGHGIEIDAADLGTKQTTPAGGASFNVYRFGADGRENTKGNFSLDDVAMGDIPITVTIEPHAHNLDIGQHIHTARVLTTGNAENTVKNMAFHYIVRAA